MKKERIFESGSHNMTKSIYKVLQINKICQRNILCINLLSKLIILFVFCFTTNIFHLSALNQLPVKDSKRYAPFFLGKYKENRKPVHIMCISIPKCGTHLFYRCMIELNLKNFKHPAQDGMSEDYKNKVRAMNENPPPNHYRGMFHLETVGPIPKKIADRLERKTTPHTQWSHWPYTVESEELFNKYCYANFICIRDPRPMLISMVHMVSKSNECEIDFTTALMDLIDGGQRQFIKDAVVEQQTHPIMWEMGLVKFYNLYLPWMEARKFYTVRFENLIGTKGGGSEELQIEEIKKIARHCGKKITSAEAKEIAGKIFGDTVTFREGKIDGWKEVFTPEIKEFYKKTPGANQLLIDLGYEENEDW